MSIYKTISTLPDTKQSFDSRVNGFAPIKGLFGVKSGTSFASVEAFQDIDNWYTLLESGDMFPLHYAVEFDAQDEDMFYGESLQDFSYKQRNGRYRHKISYVFNIDVHQAVSAISDSSNIHLFYWDKNNNIYGTSDDGVTVRGFKPNRFTFEKLLFARDNEPAFSVLDIELQDSDELNLRGVVKQVAWSPQDVDRLFISINIGYTASDQLTFEAYYMSTPIAGLSAGDMSLTDDVNGALTFTVLNFGYTYILSSFNLPLNSGVLKILSSLYLGCTKYNVTITVIVTYNAIFDDATGNNIVFEDLNNMIFDN